MKTWAIKVSLCSPCAFSPVVFLVFGMMGRASDVSGVACAMKEKEIEENRREEEEEQEKTGCEFSSAYPFPYSSSDSP
jgi:hypothetical protein